MRTFLPGIILAGITAQAGATSIHSALGSENFGLQSASQFRLADGHCDGCGQKQALWYFQDEVIALPSASATDAPGLVWVGSPQLVPQARFDGEFLHTADGSTLNLRLAPKIATNRSYFNASSEAFFRQREVRVRGQLDEKSGQFVARTIWPSDFVIDSGPPLQPLAGDDNLQGFVRHANGGARSGYAVRKVWQRPGAASPALAGKPVLAIVLSGAQGDDDEAFGGHFAIATGKLGQKGEWSDWLVNNFYNLDSFSEKGIVASAVPMDNYLMDLNSGQQYYRPSYMLVAVLDDARTAQAFQGKVNQVYREFYAHHFSYKHAADNCAGISVDVLRKLGWQWPFQGPTNRLKALGAFAYMGAKEMSFASGRKAYEYFTEEQTRLHPAVAFDALGRDLLAMLVGDPGRELSGFEQQLKSDVAAVMLVRIPQVPSSRAFGSAPAYSIDEFMARAPADRSKWQVVPTEPRPFPEALMDAQARANMRSSAWPVAGVLALLGAIGTAWSWRRRQRLRAEMAHPERLRA
ncbi:hypothetical protein GM658_10500 [Pseudoduganella eburnea]|uniref:DUF4105 domain-containing protein n=1 Tax=Massilia eburnea TaxID=1776165 RepID=A0A6L6QFW3_9BURK|nr:hypothetical protein [Massilia eburnea]MTW11031.1 hypothetical protein [Massilia eburnea]